MTTELWTCLRLRAPALAAVRRRMARPPALLAVTDGSGQRPRILACSADAAHRGIRPGQPLPAARALCPELVVAVRDPDAEQALRELLGQWAYGFSDQVVLDLPDALALETGGSLGLFRGWPALEKQLRADLARLELDARLCVAPRPRAAWVLAGRHDGEVIDDPGRLRHRLDALPITAAGFEPATAASLRAMGLLHLRELAAIPRDSLGRRIGPTTVNQIDRLYGRCHDPLPRWQPPTGFESVLAFDHHPDTLEPLLFALRRLLAELAAVLRARDGGVQHFRIVLLHEGLPATTIAIGLLRPERDPARLLALVRARMERVSLPAPVAGLGLVADRLPAFRPMAADLFEARGQDPDGWPGLLERLRARLGDGAVLRPVEYADHRPERATGLVRTDADRDRRDRRQPAPRRPDRDLDDGGRRPVWLLPRPVPLRPAPARILSGPERLESGWWDGGDQRRDYYVVETVRGQLAWAYCAPGRREGWMLHGWFA